MILLSETIPSNSENIKTFRHDLRTRNPLLITLVYYNLLPLYSCYIMMINILLIYLYILPESFTSFFFFLEYGYFVNSNIEFGLVYLKLKFINS